MRGFSFLILVAFDLLASEALLSTFEIVILALGTLPTSVRKIKRFPRWLALLLRLLFLLL
jgi:hypothetical protein